MKNQSSYVPPPYVPLGQSDLETEIVDHNEAYLASHQTNDEPRPWSSGICACCDDMQSYGILLGLPGCFVSFYACGYRRVLREKYNLQEAPCGDFMTHFFCHLCANCQEYREIYERTHDANPTDLMPPVVGAPPPVQTMESGIAD